MIEKELLEEELRSNWRKWLNKNFIENKQISLFEIKNNDNEISDYIWNEKKYVKLSDEMMLLVRKEIGKIKNSYNEKTESYDYDGLIYIVYTYAKYVSEKLNNKKYYKENDLIPFYIGKTETYGRYDEKGIRKYSENIKNVEREGMNLGRFARWGYYEDYHIGELSNMLFENKNKEGKQRKPKYKYKKWVETFFEERNKQSNDPVISKFPVYFWMKAWHNKDKGLILDLSRSTKNIEKQLICYADMLFPEILLNID